ncbi:MAG: hypothetical protein HYX52_05790 [Chloroflexi bacterium]|nr:hypothetical protein [Chloroflexota bacterium]
MPLPREHDWRRAIDIATNAAQQGVALAQVAVSLSREGLSDDARAVAATARAFFGTAEKARQQYEEALDA